MQARVLYEKFLAVFGTDKGLHFLCGFLWAIHAALAALVSGLDPLSIFWVSFLSATFVAVLKEVADELTNRGASEAGEPQFHTSDMRDATATALGGCWAAVIVSLSVWLAR